MRSNEHTRWLCETHFHLRDIMKTRSPHQGCYHYVKVKTNSQSRPLVNVRKSQDIIFQESETNYTKSAFIKMLSAEMIFHRKK